MTVTEAEVWRAMYALKRASDRIWMVMGDVAHAKQGQTLDADVAFKNLSYSLTELEFTVGDTLSNMLIGINGYSEGES